MPPVAVSCPCDKTNKFALNHWLVGQGCPLPPQARADYQSSLTRAMSDKRHCDGNVTITRLIQDYLPFTFNPLAVNKMKIGSLVQEEIARYAEAVGAQAEVKVAGELFGLEITGSLDMVDAPLVNEGKFHGEQRMDNIMARGWAKKYNPAPQLLSDDYVAQTSMQVLLAKQSGIELDKVIVSHSSMSDPQWPSERAPLRDEEWIGNVRPMEGGFTILQNAGFVQNFKQVLSTNREEKSVINAIHNCVPKVGVTQLVNKKTGKSWVCEHCSVKDVCDAIG